MHRTSSVLSKSRKSLLPILFLTQFLYAQTGDIPIPEWTTEFSKQNTTWNWFGKLNLSNPEKSLWEWNVSESFNSNLLIPSEGKKQWKDEHKFEGFYYYPLSDLDLGIYGKSWIQSDRQVSSDNRFENHIIGVTAKYDETPGFSIKPYSGYQQSVNRSNTDWGWEAGVKGSLNNYELGDYRANLQFDSDYDFYKSRQNFENQIGMQVATRFNNFTSDSLSLSYSETSKQYYGATSSDLLHLTLYNRSIDNRLVYQLSSGNLITLDTKIFSKNISSISSRDVLQFENRIRFYRIGRKLSYNLSLWTNDETQDNTGIRTDSRTRQTAVGLQSSYKIDQNNHFSIDFDYVKLQYDTPDSVNNNDDRDEQRFVVHLNYTHRFSPLLEMRWQAYTYLYHQIYIFREQSANNNWNRVFRLNPQVIYKYNNTTNTLSTSVQANYTVYDFDPKSEQIRSYIFRKYTISDSLITPFYKKLNIGIHSRLELEEKGSFFKDEFAQNKIQSHRSQFLNIFLYHEKIFQMRVTAGYSLYARQEWRHVPVKKKVRDIVNQGPYLTLLYHHSERLDFSAYAALSTLDDSQSSKTSYSTGQIKLYYNF